jgi:hypothetical protein
MEANDYQRLARWLRTSHLHVGERMLTYFADRECLQWVESGPSVLEPSSRERGGQNLSRVQQPVTFSASLNGSTNIGLPFSSSTSIRQERQSSPF